MIWNLLKFLRIDKKPLQTDNMRLHGLIWKKIDGVWREACETCGGNCGQCGQTGRLGNIPVDMNTIIKSHHDK